MDDGGGGDGLCVQQVGRLGTARGVDLADDHRAWLGIPYAKPPVGPLRFAPPQRHEGWAGVLEATTQPNAPQQSRDTAFGDFKGATMWNPNTPVSEDCLYLNVYAPRECSEMGKLPVLVRIYGGGFMCGSIALDYYNPAQYVKRKVVFVAMQYRVGAHGFLCLGEESGAPGNVGLLDQVMALEWVRDNVASFGGDPSNVTIMGNSAGAASVAMHMVSPRSAGLFQKAILQVNN